MGKAERFGGYELTSDQQRIVDDGLRVLARIIVKRFHQDAPQVTEMDESKHARDV